MGMTPRDLVKFEKLCGLIQCWQQKNRVRGKTLEERIEDLEMIILFSLLCDAGEQGVTPEQRECLRRIGMLEIFESMMAELGKK